MLAICQLGFVVNRRDIRSIYVVDEGRPVIGASGTFSGSAREYSSKGKRIRNISNLQRPQGIRVTKSNIYVTDLGASIAIGGIRTGGSGYFLCSKHGGDYDSAYNPFQIYSKASPRFIIVYVKGTNYFEYWIPNDTGNYSYCAFDHSVGTNTGAFNMPGAVRQCLETFTGQERVIVEGMYSNAPRVRKYDLKGESIFDFGMEHGGENGQFNGARGIEVMEDIIYVVDSGNKRVQVFDEYGTYQSQFSVDGTPHGIYIDQKNQLIYITAGNCRIYSLGGGLIKSFGSFSYPQGITGAEGKIYVADTGNNKILTFDLDGEFISEFGSGGSKNGQFNGPTDVEVINNRLFVADRGNYRMQVFTKEGIYIKKFALTGLFLRGIAGKRK